MPIELLLLLAVALVTLKVGLIFQRRVRQMEADDLMAVADTVLVDQRRIDDTFAAIAAMEPDVAALGRIIAADLYLSEEDS